ncbi:unnamed protein product [Rhizoctonia solani]|uniref:Uncharacterized protein n=1 Tax=Rhizoctonia solani TaxID=456999 RepID=A0A8H3CB40_9AGAM|nr:unnamed protein product [Rhizoctonia solani]
MAIVSYNSVQSVPASESATVINGASSGATDSGLILPQPALMPDSGNKFTWSNRGKCQAVIAAPSVINTNTSPS